MKYLLVIIFLFFTGKTITAQDCKALNDFNSFHGIKFGQLFSDSIKKYFQEDKEDPSYIDYILDRENLQNKNELFKKFYKWFNFGESWFSSFTTSCLTDGKVYEFSLIKIYNKNDISSIEDSIEIVNERLPKTYIKATEEITSLFGKMTKTETENDILGSHFKRIWECEKNKIELSLWYKNDSNLKYPSFTLVTNLTITNKELDKNRKLNNYQN